MKKSEIIDSGLLEEYALGLLSGDELSMVESAIKSDSKVATEYEVVQKDLELIARAHHLQPSTTVKSKIFSTIENDTSIASFGDKKQTIPQSDGVWFWQMVSAAAILLFFLSTAYAFWMTNRFNQTVDRLAVLESEQSVWSESLQNARNLELILGNPDYTRIELSGNNAHAIVYWNKKTQEVFVEASGLEPLNAEESYQLWALYDSSPIDAGVFNKDTIDDNYLAFHKLKATEKAQAFAITIEPRGGKPSPTLSRLTVSGAVNS